MCNCGKGRRAAIPGTGPQGGGSRGLPVARAVPPTTVAPMPKVASQPTVSQILAPAPAPRSRGVVSVRRAMPLATVAPTPASVATQVSLQSPAPVVIPSPPMRSRGGVRPPVAHGTDPAIWGPSAWYILHTLAELASRSTDDRLAVHWAPFIEAMAVSIPCPTCARHFRRWMGWVPFEASVDAATVRTRFAELHNLVNRTKKVPEWTGDLATTYTGSADDVRARVAAMRGIIGDAMLNSVEDMLNML